MTDPSTPGPSDDTIRAAVKAAMVANGSENRDLPVTTRGRIVAAVEAAAPILRAEAAAEARAATLREVREAERELAIQRDYYWQALTDIAGYEGWQAGGVASVRVMGDIARAALAHFDPEGNR